MDEPIIHKKKKQLSKGKVAAVSIFGIILSIMGVSYAFYHNETKFINEFKTMTYNVNLEEEFNGDFGTKKVKIVNEEETNVDVVLRLNFNETWTKVNNNQTYFLNNYNDTYNCVYKEWTADFLNDFVLGDDGWYYYKKKLLSQGEVKILESISDNNVCNYQDANYELDFNYEAIQADSNAVSDIWGYNITISNNDVTWPFSGNNPNINQLRG